MVSAFFKTKERFCSEMSSSSAQQRMDFPRLRTISQHRFTKVHRVSFIVLRAQSSPFVAKRALAPFVSKTCLKVVSIL